MADFQTALKKTLRWEGSFSDDKFDPGGKTRWGITETVARANGYTGTMETLPQDTAMSIYKKQYWDTLRLDSVTSQAIASIVWDMGVNCGVGAAGRALQTALNLSNKNSTLWQDINVDGVIGPVTISMMNNAIASNPKAEKTIFEVMIALRMEYYIEIVKKKSTSEVFLLGWLNRVLDYANDL
jgi:lysozyme family protein